MNNLERNIYYLEHITVNGEGHKLDADDIENIEIAIEFIKELRDLSEMVDEFHDQTKAYIYK